MTSTLAPYDAILLLSFGGPERPEDVVPFLRNVTHGRGIPDERLEEVGEHYYHFGGRSPINDQNKALLAALREELDRRGLDLPVAWGNRNWDPYLTDALRDLHAGGARRVLTIVTSAYASYSGCRQYRENIADSLARLAGEGIDLDVDKIRAYFNHPGFVDANVDAVVAAYERLGAAPGPDAPLVFVTHSIPTTMEVASGTETTGSYSIQHLDVAALIAKAAGERLGHPVPWELAYCSRSGTPLTPWTEPDVNRTLHALHADGAAQVVLAPIGFVSDHMEVIYDLDTEARATADELGMRMERAGTAGTAPEFVAGLVDLLVERAATERGEAPERVSVGALGAWPDVCRPGCCRLRAGVDSGVPAACEQPAGAAV
ncbi:ferrochelatase [Georgenia thermotolerans]|uniref:Coproporphyrin III ferrochelatase n=1 Tax=Georgenia thermotolerans TaxID=527326 RepID=A0A7J5UIB1_9MICO|nr:ferrochelatase [Georgenia thermotolerans]KAE8762108.1 ferrochelatase [Georgenia thermotolerans]